MKIKTIVPVEIEPKFIPFLYKNFGGQSAEFKGKKIKTIDLRRNSSLGKFLRLQCIKAEIPVTDISKYNLFIILSERNKKGSIYKVQDGRSVDLSLPKEVVADFNKMIEQEFNIVFMTYVEGYVNAVMEQSHYFSDRNPEGKSKRKIESQGVKDAIKKFIEKYELDNFSTEPYTHLERRYYRYRNRPKLQNLQKSL